MNQVNKSLALPLLITRGAVVFPNLSEAIEVARPFSMAAVDFAKKNTNNLIFVVAQKKLETNEPTQDDLYTVGTLCRIVNYLSQEKSYRIRVIGSKRIKFDSIYTQDGSYMATGYVLENVLGDQKEENDLVKKLLSAIESSPNVGRNIPRAALATLSKGVDSSTLADNLAAYLPLSTEDKQAILEKNFVNERLTKLLEELNQAQEIAEVDQKITEKVHESAEKSQKEYYLREKMKAIRQELGEDADSENNEDAINEKLNKYPYPENVKARVKKELKRYKMMPEASLEASLVMSYIDTLLAAPWYQKSEDNDDLDNVRKILDEDHYGLEKVKKRIVEYIAVKKMTGNLKAPILCFYGPPGCGKTSLAKSIARALNRKFFKAALGGIGDEAEIRGHRRTYVGSMPGRIIQGMSKVGTINPVFLLDEIDKVGGSSMHGDPSSALLEVLDPEQNFAFNDNFIEEPYDLSNVLFIATANYLENVPAPLRDRLELIEVPSYTELEKIQIAKNFLLKKQMDANGLKEGDIVFKDETYSYIIEHYTMEAGVRSLERLIASICRKVVVELLSNPKIEKPIVVDEKKANEYLGVEVFEGSKKEKENQIGVVTGLAYTEFGGDILPIEVTYFSGHGGLVLTGKLGEVMKESATIAVDYVRANAKKYGIDEALFKDNDIHIHVPEGAVPKDGPSAGVAITCAIVSSLSATPVKADVAMTGEVTLRGKALPIGGLREKSLAALRSGIKQIIVPIDNKKDVSELPKEVLEKLKISYMTCVDDALAICLAHQKA